LAKVASANRAGEFARNLRQRWRRQVKRMPLQSSAWCYSRRPQRGDPAQGWKLHVSATLLSATEVFSRARPILAAYDALFKVPARLEVLAQINRGAAQFSQVGKFLTIYPRSLTEACELAHKLHVITRDLQGPEIPFDFRYRNKSLVYYRYGAFRKNVRGTRRGEIIFDPAGKPHPDLRGAGCAVPRWMSDPFKRPQQIRSRQRTTGRLWTDLLPFRVITQRGKGGVYEAVDLSVSPARLVIIKEGRRNGEVGWDGEDGYARVKREGRILRQLRAADVPVPCVRHAFSENGARYLVLEKVGGRPLLSPNRIQPTKRSWRRAQRIVEQLRNCLSRMHAAGWVWRDCKPWHIFVHRGQMHLIDFEGACRRWQRQVLPWGSQKYMPSATYRKFYRRAGAAEDYYAMGVIAFQFLSGEFPAASARVRAAVYKRTGCPNRLRAKIESLLKF
jgi:hypothetical protein